MDTEHVLQLLKNTGRCALDLVLPRRCPACNSPHLPDGLDPGRGAFCPPCWHAVLEVSEPCACCGLPDAAPLCDACRRDPPPYARACAPFVYGGQLAVAIGRFKYGRATHLGHPLGALVGNMLPVDCRVDLVIPVPLHPRRLRERGFNQAALLARRACKGSGLKIRFDLLIRRRDTDSQANLGPAQRRQNVRGAFAVHGSGSRGQRVLLLDDVMTTGATASACSLALLEAGAREVHVLTLARAVP